MHERRLRIIYNSNLSTFDEILESDNSLSVHYKNLLSLTIELYKIFNGIYPDVMQDVFPLNQFSIHDIRKRLQLYIRPVKSVYKGTESLLYSVIYYAIRWLCAIAGT